MDRPSLLFNEMKTDYYLLSGFRVGLDGLKANPSFGLFGYFGY